MASIPKLTALGLYKAVTTELDKTNSASFSITQFNYYANREQLSFMADLADIFERTQVISDLMAPFVARKVYTASSTPPILTGQLMAQPDDYQQALKATLVYTANAAFGAYRQNETFTRTAKRVTADQQAYIEEPNHYLKPTFDRTYRRIVGGFLEIYSGIHSRLTLTRVTFEYLKRPEEIILFESDTTDLTNDNSQVLQWTANATYELAKYMVKAIMEQSGNQRLPGYAQLNTPNVGAPPQPPQNPQGRQRAVATDEQATG